MRKIISLVKKMLIKCKVLLRSAVKEGISVSLYYIKACLNKKEDYCKWIEENEKDILLTRDLKYNPLISVVIPVYNVPDQILVECIESVLAQTYSNWQLCLADDCSTQESMRDILKKYENGSEIKVVYRKENGHISRATNSAIDLADGEYIAFMDCDDLLAPNALYEVALKLNENPQYDFIYSDEDKISEDGKRRWDPHFKPDWSPDTFMELMYTSHLGVYRTNIVKEIGGLRVGFEGSQDYDFTLRFVEKTEPRRIAHIEKILYHWRQIEGSTAVSPEAKPYVFEAAKKAKEEALQRRNLKGKIVLAPELYQERVLYENQNKPLVSIIIPSKDNVKIYKQCIDSLHEKTGYTNFEVIHVDNGSDEENRKAYAKIDGYYNQKYCYKKMDFNFSCMCNEGARQAQGEYYLFLNDDIEIIENDWLGKMVGQATPKHVGAVGAKLLYPNGTLIQHCGIVNLEAGPSHFFVGYDDKQVYYYGRNKLNYNVSAVTGACLLIEKQKFYEIGGFDENLPVAYNDVDLCFTLIEKGYFNVVCNNVVLYHHESVSRGYDNQDEEKMKRLIRERNKLYSKHPDFLMRDPFYNSNLVKNDVNCRINMAGCIKYNHMIKAEGTQEKLHDGNVKAEIDCIRITDYIFLQGYAFLENKRYNNQRKAKIVLKGNTETIIVDTNKICRPDLQQRLQTKKYINLTGFNAYIDKNKLSDQEYVIKILMDEKVSDFVEKIKI